MDYHRHNVARIRSYLEEYRHTYHRDALRRKLIADGHDPDAVDEAIAEVYAQKQETDAPEPIPFASLVLRVVVINTVLLLPIGPISFSIQHEPTQVAARSRIVSELYPLLWIVLGAIIIELIVGIAITYGRAPFIRRQTVLPGIAGGSFVSLAITLVVFGICVSTL